MNTPQTPHIAEQNQPITKREWRFVWAVILAVLIFTSLPYVYGYLSSPSDKVFMGLMLDVPDHGQYLSWWRGFQHDLLISNKLTPEPNGKIFFNLLWWTLAQVSKLTGLGYAPVFQIFRWIAGGSFLYAVYRLIAQFLDDVQQRHAAFLLITLSSGFGWVLILLKYTLTQGELLFPLDVYIAEGNSFLCILAFPHFTFALTFISLILEFIWRGWKTKRITYMICAAILSFLLGWMHTYDLLIIYGVMGTFALLIWIKERKFPRMLFWGGLIVGLVSCPGALYSVALTSIDPLWEEVLAQFANAGVYTPTPPHMVILFGLPLILAVMTWGNLVYKREWSAQNLFMLGWFAGGAMLNYIPTDFQIHMLNSWQIPMMILMTKGLYDIFGPALTKIRSRGQQKSAGNQNKVTQWLVLLCLIAVLPTNVYLWVWRFLDLSRHDYPYYLHKDDIAALNWLEENSNAHDVVLSSITVGQYIPAMSGNTAFLAHWAQTVNYYDKVERVESFFETKVADAERVETVCTFAVDYVFYGPAERALGQHNPVLTPWLKSVFSSDHVNVYAVNRECEYLNTQSPARSESGSPH